MDLYLIRETRLFAKYTACTKVEMSGQPVPYGSVTGIEATNTVYVPNSAFFNGYTLTFTSLTGGAGLTAGTKYYVISVSGTSMKLATSLGGTAIDFSTDITAATVLVQPTNMLVWSSEFRDIFSSDISIAAATGQDSYSGPGTNNVLTVTGSSVTVTTSEQSDEVAHEPLRQSQLYRSYWLFTMTGLTTCQLPAEVLEGDIISNSPPNTP